MRIAERVLFGGAREWVCRRAGGDVLESAAGTGLNLPYYPADVHLTGIDLSPAVLDIARRRAASLGREVDLRVGDAERLEFADECFDTVVCTYSLLRARSWSQRRPQVLPAGRLMIDDQASS
jgi:ubiquinone/menaquinone biosynthesis C-methylase UbiE